MVRKRLDLSWVFLGLLICLFVWIVESPRSWDRIARPQAVLNQPILSKPRISSRPLTPTPSPETPRAKASAQPVQRPVRLGTVPAVVATTLGVVPGQKDGVPVARPVAPSPSPPRLPVPAILASAPLPAVAKVEAKGDPTAASKETALPADGPALVLRLPPVTDEAVATNEAGAPVAPQPPASPGAKSSPQSDAAAVARLAVPETAGAAAKTAANDNPPGEAISMDPADSSGGVKNASPLSRRAQPAGVGKSPPAASRRPPAPFAWPEPETLLSQLDALASHATTSRWAQQTLKLVHTLGPEVSGRSAKAATTLRQLDQMVAQAILLETVAKDKLVGQDLSRAHHALARRVDVWRHVCEVESPEASAAALPIADPQALAACLADVDRMLGDGPERAAWEEFLGLDKLRAWLAGRGASGQRVPRLLVEQILHRLDATAMSPAQRQLVARGPMAALRQELLRQVAEPVQCAALLQHLETFERTGLPADARLLARDCRWLALSPTEAHRQLGAAVAAHYRNANVRIAISAELLNRLVPQRNPEYAKVDDTLLGLPVHGQSMTQTTVRVLLVPDPNRALLALQISGRVSSLTSATSGPATFVNDTNSMYTAVKPLEFDLSGIRLGETEVEVDNKITLRNVKTDFDGIPLVSQLAQGVARSQRDAKEPQLTQEVKEKVAATARARIDAETTARFTRLAGRLEEKVFTPLDALALEPAMIAAETTPQRVILRVRLAADEQLGSHTPRPQAPGDSLASFQVHESVINNMIGRLALDGRTFTLPQLSRHIACSLGRPGPSDDNPDHEDVSITFAPKDAVRVHCAEGRMEVSLSIAKLAKGEHFWKHFQVRAFYRPEGNGPVAELVRDGIIQLIGQRLSTGGQIVLRGVFSHVFSKRTPWKLTPDRLADDPRFAGIGITQFVIEDGWIGVALGERRVALRPAAARK